MSPPPSLPPPTQLEPTAVKWNSSQQQSQPWDLSCSKICIDVTGETPHTVMNWVGPSRVQLSLIFSFISGLAEMRSLPTSAACWLRLSLQFQLMNLKLMRTQFLSQRVPQFLLGIFHLYFCFDILNYNIRQPTSQRAGKSSTFSFPKNQPTLPVWILSPSISRFGYRISLKTTTLVNNENILTEPLLYTTN